MLRENQLLQLEEELRDAMMASDVTKLTELLADDLVFVTHLGHVLTKAADLQIHVSGILRINSIGFSDRHIRILSDSAVVLVRAQLVGSYDGQAFAGTFRYLRVWAERNKQWQVVSGQATVCA